MPLGKLSKSQIMKGFDVLDELDKAIKKANTANLTNLTSKFYTLIPHDFGRCVPPVIRTAEQVREKMDMLLVLADIEAAQVLQRSKTVSTDAKELPNPLDTNYKLLDCDIELLPKSSKEFKSILEYTNMTKSRTISILEAWKVNRKSQNSRFKTHNNLTNRKLLWHGTNVAVVAAILKSGLRIMPHSGGLVGKGIYFASENGKSAGYVRTAANNVGFMFLAEVALGKESSVFQCDGSLVKPPSGFDSIVARGQREPDPSKDDTLTFDGKKVTIPQGQPIQQNQYKHSRFYQSEYLIYQESQCQLRYILKCKF